MTLNTPSKNTFGLSLICIATLAFMMPNANAHHEGDHHVVLNTNDQWVSCAMVVDSTLTQNEFRAFTKDASSIISLTPKNSAQTLGKNRFDISLAVLTTAPIKDYDGSWNNTFSHPDDTHWLVGDSHRLALPVLNMHMGMTNDLDAGITFTKDPAANYGFYGFNLKYAMLKEKEKGVTVSTRAAYIGLLGVDDMNINQGEIDLLVSKQFGALKPYAGVSGLITSASETTDKVDLNRENVITAQATMGTQMDWKYLTIAAEANIANVNTYLVKVGTTF